MFLIKPKLTIVSPRSPFKYYGGVEHHVLEISKRLQKLGYELEVLATDTSISVPETKTEHDITVRTFPATAIQDSYDFSMGLYNAVKASTSEIIHVHGFYAFHMPLAALARKKNQKLILTIHSCASSSLLRRAFRLPYHMLCRKILSKTNKIVCVSNEERKQYTKFLGFPNNRYTVIPNGVNVKDFTESSSKTVSSNKYVLSVGRLEKCKGFHFLIKSFVELKNIHPDLKLEIVGTGPYKPTLVQLINSLNLQDTVTIHERISREKLVELYKGCSLFTLLSSGESSGIVVLEALAAKKPVVLTMCYALKEYVEKGLAIGLPYPPSTSEVCRSISLIIAHPNKYVPSSADVMSWDAVVDKLDNLYSEVLKEA